MMWYRMLYLFSALIFISLLPASVTQVRAQSQTVQQILWNNPDGKLLDLSQTFVTGSTITLSWNAWTLSSYINTYQYLVNLWVAEEDQDADGFVFNQLVHGMYYTFLKITAGYGRAIQKKKY
jgi:hypothetical protein